MDFNEKPMFIFEMANNHMGDVKHGLQVIKQFKEVSDEFNFRFAFKLQYRDLDTFIHPQYKERTEFKYVKRFSETRLSEKDLKTLRDGIKEAGFTGVCTPFDENSVDLVVKHNYDIIKIASCSFTDWPLLEKIAQTGKPIIISTAGATLENIDKVAAFFEHRNKQFCLMHCVGEYPTKKDNLQLNQIDFLRDRFKTIPIGFSTHEEPDNIDSIKIAIAKGAVAFERHVGVKTDNYGLNEYSSTPQQIRQWLSAAQETFLMCGVKGKRRDFSEKERDDLRGLMRGMFAKKSIKKGENIDLTNTFFAIPNSEGHIMANDFSKYTEFIADHDIQPEEPILFKDVKINNLREKVTKIINDVKKILHDAKINLPDKTEVEISHHYGLDNYNKWGATIINCINREYCKKIIVLLPGQSHPYHYHKKKEETFHILYGSIIVNLDGDEKEYKAGDMIIVERGVNHSFKSLTGGIFEEISTTHYTGDSYYEDETILSNSNRKTAITFYSNWYMKPL